MNDFRNPVSVPQADSLQHYVQEHNGGLAGAPDQRPKGWPWPTRLAHLFNLNRMPMARSIPTPKLGLGGPGAGAYVPVQLSAVANLVPHEYLAPRRIVRMWNPALTCAPNPFGAASNGVHYSDNVGSLVFIPVPEQKVAVLAKLNVFRPAPIRAAAGQANARPGAGGSGSVENARVPAVSTLSAF